MKRKSYLRQKKREKRTRKILTLFIACVTAFVVVFISLRMYIQVAGAPPLTVPKASIFLDATGNQIGDHFANERRYWVELDKISPFLINAVVVV